MHQHQKFKHFICEQGCHKKFSSLDSMLSHYKTSNNHNMVERVPNAIPGRESIGLKIFGMQGVPRVEVETWILKGADKYWGKLLAEKNKKRAKEEKLRDKRESEENGGDEVEGGKESGGLEMVEEKKEE